MAQTMPGGSDSTEVAGGIHPQKGFLFTPDDSIAGDFWLKGTGPSDGEFWGWRPGAGSRGRGWPSPGRQRVAAVWFQRTPAAGAGHRFLIDGPGAGRWRAPVILRSCWRWPRRPATHPSCRSTSSSAFRTRRRPEVLDRRPLHRVNPGHESPNASAG